MPDMGERRSDPAYDENGDILNRLPCCQLRCTVMVRLLLCEKRVDDLIFKQPNGLYGRVSSVVDAPTHVDMTENDLHLYLMDTMQYDYSGQNVKEWLDRYGGHPDDAIAMVRELNMTNDEIEEWKKQIERQVVG